MSTTADRDILFVGDTFDLEAVCYEDAPTNTNYNAHQARVPMNPVAATATLWNLDLNEVVPLGEDSDAADCTVEGNVVTYSVASEHTAEAATYRLYLTISFDGGMVETVVREFRVKPHGV